MEKIIGLGSAGCNIVSEFEKYPQYDSFKLDVGLKGLKKDGIYEISAQGGPEQYEEACPSVRNFLKGAVPSVLFVVNGSGNISGAALALLEQIKDRDIHVLFIKSGERRMSNHATMLERAAFGILQEYARSGLFQSFTVVSNKSMEQILGKTPVIGYYEAINNFLVNTIHMVNVFDNTVPVVSDFSPIAEINRISTYGFSKFDEKEQDSLFFPLDNIRQMSYYFAINREQLENDGTVNEKINEYLEASEIKEIDVSYGIYPTNYEQNFVYCKAYTNQIQEYK
jgi:hypothetical protein